MNKFALCPGAFSLSENRFLCHKTGQIISLALSHSQLFCYFCNLIIGFAEASPREKPYRGGCLFAYEPTL